MKIFSYVLLIGAFGVVVPAMKGLSFFNPELLSAYACMGMLFSGPAAAQAFKTKPGSTKEALRWILQAAGFGEILALAMLGCGVLTVYLTHLRSVFIPPDVYELTGPIFLGLTGSLGMAALAAWLTLAFSANVARGVLRAVFLALLLLFFLQGPRLPSVAAYGALFALVASAIFLWLVRSRLSSA